MFKSLLIVAIVSMCVAARAADGDGKGDRVNVAVVAKATASFVSGHESLAAINDGFEPRDSRDHRHGAYGNWPRRGTQWVQLEWSQPISTDGVDVYWWDDNQGVRAPKAARRISQLRSPASASSGIGARCSSRRTSLSLTTPPARPAPAACRGRAEAES